MDALLAFPLGRERADENDKKMMTLVGYKSELYVGFNGFMAFAFCFTAVSIIPSISLGFNDSIFVGGPAVLAWCWIICSFFVCITGVSMAEISSNFPSAGSVYHWAGQLGPERWARLSAYVTG